MDISHAPFLPVTPKSSVSPGYVCFNAVAELFPNMCISNAHLLDRRAAVALLPLFYCLPNTQTPHGV